MDFSYVLLFVIHNIKLISKLSLMLQQSGSRKKSLQQAKYFKGVLSVG